MLNGMIVVLTLIPVPEHHGACILGENATFSAEGSTRAR